MADGKNKEMKGGIWMAKKKLSTKSIVSAILLVTMIYLMLTSTVLAATEINKTFADKNISVTGSVNGTWDVFSATSNAITATLAPAESGSSNNKTYSSQTDTVTFTNNNTGSAVVSFKYKKTASTGTVTVNGVTATTVDQEATISLAAGGTFTVVLTSGAAEGANATISITDFAVTVEETFTITLNTPSNGSYTVSSTDGDPAVTMTPDTAPTQYSYVSTAGVSITTSPANNYKFDRVENSTTGAVLTYTNNPTISSGLENGNTLSVSFIPSGSFRAFTVGDNKYYSWEDAMDAAVSSGKPVILSQAAHTLPATEAEAIAAAEKLPGQDADVSYIQLVNKDGTNYLQYIVPSGVTFAIPYDATLSTGNDYDTSTVVNGKAAYVLTVKDGTELVVQNGGTFLVNAKRTCSGTKNQGVTTGNYGKLVMGGTMTIESGGSLVARGYIVDTDHKSHSYGTGTGRIIAKSGSNVEILFQILTHRGGTATTNVVGMNKTKRIMPITDYAVSNVMMRAEVEYGAHVRARYLLYIKDYFDGTVSLVDADGTANTLFTMSSDCRLVMDYDYATDRMYVVAEQGTMSLQNIQLTFKNVIEYNINTADYILPVGDSMQIYAGAPGASASDPTATVKVSNPIKLLPGSAIHVMKNGVLDVTSELYLYADEDYDITWSYGTYRTTLYNAENFKGKSARLSITEDAAIYLGGTANISGTLLQSGTDVGQDKTNRIIPTSDTAVLNVNNLVTSGTVNELSNVDTSNYVANTSWKAIDGLFVNSTEYTTFTGTGTYRAAKQGDDYKWYICKIAYEFRDEAGNKLTGLTADGADAAYVIGDSTTLEAKDLVGGNYVIKGYTVKDTAGADITATTSVSATGLNPDAGNDVSYGWENITFSGLTDDIAVTLTVATYDNRVTWTVNSKESTAADTSWTDYVTDNASFTPAVDTPCAFDVKITDGTANTKWEPSYVTEESGATTSTVTVSGIENDISVDVRYASDTYKVTWNVTDWNGTVTTTSEYVQKGGEIAYNVPQTEDAWYIITNDPNPDSVTTVTNTGTALKLTGVNDTTVVDLTLTKYDYMVSVTGLTNLTDNASVTIDPYYFNKGDKMEVTGDDFVEGKRFTFTQVNSCTPDTVPVSLTLEKMTVTAPDSGAKTITILVELDAYDYKVVVKDGTSVLDTQYVDGNSTSYTFADGIYVEKYTTSGTATVTLTNPTVSTAASIAITDISKDVTVTATTAKYSHILTLVDENNNVLGDLQYLSGTSYTYTIESSDLHYVTNAVVTSDSAEGTAVLSEVGGKSLTISEITGNPTVQLTLQEYVYTVVWNDKSGNNLKVDYILDGQTETSYTCDEGYVAQLNSVGAASDSKHSLTTADNKTYKVTNISSNMTIVLDLITYDYTVTVDDGEKTQNWYVKNDEDVLNGGEIIYQTDDGKYITGYELTGTAAADGSANTNPDVADGWESIVLTGIGSDVTLDVTLASYDYRVTWNVKTSVNGVGSTVTSVSYITGDTAEYVLDEQYTITNIVTTGGTTSGVGTNVAQVSGIDKDIKVTVDARDYLYEIIWTYTLNGETVTETQVVQSEHLEEDGTVKWAKVPVSDEEGVSYVVTEVTVLGGTARHTNKTVNVMREGNVDPVRVTIKLEEALTNYTALWGNMSFRYYKNAAYYGWDGTSYQWKLIEQYAWTHKSGSMIHSYADLNDSSVITQYNVPNGSVMIVNPTNQKITATVTIQMNDDPAIWKTSPVVTLVAEDGTTGTHTITVTLEARSTMLISATLEGEPQDNLTDQATGKCSVQIDPID